MRLTLRVESDKQRARLDDFREVIRRETGRYWSMDSRVPILSGALLVVHLAQIGSRWEMDLGEYVRDHPWTAWLVFEPRGRRTNLNEE